MSAEMQTKVQASPAQNFMPVQTGLLQRTCALCNTPELVKDSGRDQEKLTLQRSSVDQAGITTVPPIVHEVLRSPGQPLDAATRAYMEPRFGHDFSRVRVHTDGKAADSAQAVNARAYTVGRDVVFGKEQYEPRKEASQRLLAHELTHVVQQSGLLHVQRSRINDISLGDTGEIEADQFSRIITLPIEAGVEFHKVDVNKSGNKSSIYENVASLHNVMPHFSSLGTHLARKKNGPGKRYNGSKVIEWIREEIIKKPKNEDQEDIKEWKERLRENFNSASAPEEAKDIYDQLRGKNKVMETFFNNQVDLEMRVELLGILKKKYSPESVAPDLKSTKEEHVQEVPVASQPTERKIYPPEYYSQLKCVIGRGLCPQGYLRPGGTNLPYPEGSEEDRVQKLEFEKVNNDCSLESEYKGEDIKPTEAQCDTLLRNEEGMVTTSNIDFVSSERLEDLKVLLVKYGWECGKGSIPPNHRTEIDNLIEKFEEAAGISSIDQSSENIELALAGPPPYPVLRPPPYSVLAVEVFLKAKTTTAAVAAETTAAALMSAFVYALAALLMAAGLCVIGILISGYLIKVKLTLAVEQLIKALLKTVVGAGETIPLPPVQQPHDEDEDEQCPYPIGTMDDPIPMTWFKPIEKYPRGILLYDKLNAEHWYDALHSKALPDSDEEIGVNNKYWPEIGKAYPILKYPSVQHRKESNRFRDMLRDEYCYDWNKFDQDADHVLDIAFNGPDSFENLWPYDRKTNRDAGKKQNIDQKVTFCDDKKSPVPNTNSIGDMLLLNRWFYRQKIEDPK